MTKSILPIVCRLVPLFALPSLCLAATAAPSSRAQELLARAGVHGGLVVHLNCADGKLTAALRINDGYLVQGLTRKPEQLARARAALRGQGLYGPVSIALWTGVNLPYIDNTVDLLVAEGPLDVSRDEILRVLVPEGVALLREAGQWRKIVKPRPGNIDEWTHYLHDPSNNAVAHDTAIGPLRHLQWDASPRYSRHHEFTSSVAALVSARGRVFSIMDLGSRASIYLPSKWRLTAREAFNGIVLWEQPLESWFNHLWPLKDGPAQPPRRLVADGDSVYVTLSLDAPVSRLDAATGKILRTYAGTEFTEEILYAQGTLFLLKNDHSMNPSNYFPKLMVCWDEKNRTMKESEGWLLQAQPRHVLAVDARTGKTLWSSRHPVEPLTLAADEHGVYFHDWTRLVCLDRKTGQPHWQSEPIVPRDNMGYVNGPSLVLYDDVLLFADGRRKRTMYAFAKQDGKPLWQAPHYAAGHAGSPEDLFVIDGLVWCGKIAGGRSSGVYTGRDPHTGEVKREFTPDVKTYWFHHRCYRAKATDRYILPSRTGIEFVDVINEHWEPHHWTRGACNYGIMPCNGLIYAPPSPCACYLESKLSGFNALAPASQRTAKVSNPAKNRLFKGPAYGSPLNSQPSPLNSTKDWPTYRHDFARSGATKTKVNTPLANQWRIELGDQLTSPVIADGRVYVASQSDHTLHALKANSGETAWTFTAGARVDSPPTLDQGRVIFGSADGDVYCLRASDGVLVWRFRAAPRDERLVSYGRLESVWPVHGNVLVQQGVAYCVAGRSTFLDGGLHFCRLNAATGKLLSEQIFNDQQSPQRDVAVLNMPTALPDILSTDGRTIFMRSESFDLEGNPIARPDLSNDPFERATQQLGPGTHLFSATGFLDDNAWHRSYWTYGRASSYGCNWWFRSGRYAPAGRLLVFDQDHVFGFGREPGLFVWSHVLENQLFCAAKQAKEAAIDRVKQWSKSAGRNGIFNREFTRQAPPEKRFAPELEWSVTHPPLQVRALVLANDTLFLAGPPDVLDEDEAFKHPFDPDIQAQEIEQDEAYAGKHGALLLGVAARDGKTQFQLNLPAPPVWDGMAAAEGKLFVADKAGYLACLSGN